MEARTKQRIVVGVDGSDGARTALHWAIDEARLRDATLEVLMAWEHPVWLAHVEPPAPPTEDLEAAARRTLEHLVASLGGSGVTLDSELVQSSASAALTTASLDADLLVVGSRGRSAVAGVLLGSVSLYCVHHAACPVVVVPSPDGDEPS